MELRIRNNTKNNIEGDLEMRIQNESMSDMHEIIEVLKHSFWL